MAFNTLPTEERKRILETDNTFFKEYMSFLNEIEYKLTKFNEIAFRKKLIFRTNEKRKLWLALEFLRPQILSKLARIEELLSELEKEKGEKNG